MRYGCCANMVSSCSDGTGIEIIEKLKEIGYDYIELPLAQMTTLSDEQFESLKQRIMYSGIKCEVCNNLFPMDMRLTGDSIDSEKTNNYIQKALKRAFELQVEFVVFGSGSAKMVPKGFPLDEAWLQIVTLLIYIDSVSKKYGITIVIEPLRKFECNIINSIKEGLKLSKEVDRDNVKLLVDFYHMSIENENAEILLETKNYLKHVHLANSIGRIFPKNINEDNYIPFINNIKEIGYNGRISIEAFSKDFPNDAVESINFLKKYF